MRNRGLTEWLTHALILVIVLVPIFPGVFLRGELLVPGECIYNYAPWASHRPADLARQNPLGVEVPTAVNVWYAVTEMAFDRGEWPLWSPMQFTGAPLLANFQSAVFYPPRLIFRVFDDTSVAMTLYILLRFWLCGFNAYVCARLLRLGVAASRFFSIAYMLAGYNLLWCFYPPPDVMAWFPYLFLGVERLLAGSARTGFPALFFGAVTALLPGHPATFVMACSGLALYAVIRLAAGPQPAASAMKSAPYAAGAFALALAVCAIQVIPFLEYVRNGALIIDYFFEEGVKHYLYRPADLLGLWAPRFHGTEHEGRFWGTTNHTYLGMLYTGIPVWVGVLLLAARPELERNARIRIRALLAASAIALYLATDLPGAGAIQSLPLFDGARPAYFVAFAAFAFPLASALVFEAWLGRERSVRSLCPPMAVAAILALAIFGGFQFATVSSIEYINARHKTPDLAGYVLRQSAYSLAFAVSTFLILATAAKGRRRSSPVLMAIAVVLVIDHAAGIRGLLPTTPRAYLFPRTEVTDYLRELPAPTRVRFDPLVMPAGFAANYGIEEMRGYDAMYPARFRPVFDRLDTTPGTAVDNLLAAPIVLLPEWREVPEGYEILRETEDVRIARNWNAVPRVRLVDRVERFDSAEAMFERMGRPDFDPARVVLCDVATVPELPETGDGPPGEARIAQWNWNRVTVDVEANKRSVLVMADAYFPGWEARIDGESVDIFPAYHFFRGVVVPEGKHTVELVYRPASFRIGAYVSVVALGFSIIPALGLLARGKGASTRRIG